jgi:hypothetical protein
MQKFFILIFFLFSSIISLDSTGPVCKVSYELIGIDGVINEYIDLIRINDELKIVIDSDGLMWTFIKTVNYMFSRLKSKKQKDYNIEEIEDCFMFDNNEEYTIVIDFEGFKPERNYVFEIANAKGLGFVVKYFTFVVETMLDEKNRTKYCGTIFSSTWDNFIREVSCQAFNFLSKIPEMSKIDENNPFFEVVDKETGIFTPRRELAEKVAEFQRTRKMPKVRFDYYKRIKEYFSGVSESTKTKISEAMENTKLLANYLGIFFKGKNFSLPFGKIRGMIEKEMKELKFQMDTNVNQFKQRIMVLHNITKNSNPNTIALCKQKSGQHLCLRPEVIENFEANGNPIWTGPAPHENQDWGLGFTNFFKSLINFIVDLFGLFLGNCLPGERDPANGKYCFWVDGFWDSVYNMAYPYFVGVLDWISWLFGRPECDPNNSGCSQYSTYPGYFLGVWKLLNFWNSLIEYPPCLIWCLIWNSFLILFPLVIIGPIVVVVGVSLTCLLLCCSLTSRNIKNKQIKEDHEKEITESRGKINRLERRMEVIERKDEKKQENISSLRTELLNLSIVTEDFVQENKITLI